MLHHKASERLQLLNEQTLKATGTMHMNLHPFSSHLIDCTPFLCTIARENTVAGHSCGGILVNCAPTPCRVGVEHTGGDVAPELVLEQPPTAASHPIAGESAVLHRACNQLVHVKWPISLAKLAQEIGHLTCGHAFNTAL